MEAKDNWKQGRIKMTKRRWEGKESKVEEIKERNKEGKIKVNWRKKIMQEKRKERLRRE